MTGAVASERVSEALKGSLRMVGNHLKSAKAAGIKVCQDLDGMTVREAVEKYKNGDAPFADAPNK